MGYFTTIHFPDLGRRLTFGHQGREVTSIEVTSLGDSTISLARAIVGDDDFSERFDAVLRALCGGVDIASVRATTATGRSIVLEYEDRDRDKMLIKVLDESGGLFSVVPVSYIKRDPSSALLDLLLDLSNVDAGDLLGV